MGSGWAATHSCESLAEACNKYAPIAVPCSGAKRKFGIFVLGRNWTEERAVGLGQMVLRENVDRIFARP